MKVRDLIEALQRCDPDADTPFSTVYPAVYVYGRREIVFGNRPPDALPLTPDQIRWLGQHGVTGYQSNTAAAVYR